MFESPGIQVPVLGLVENMSWFTPAELPENKYYLFGKEGGKLLAEEKGLRLLGQIPVVQRICEGGDAGTPSLWIRILLQGKHLQSWLSMS